MVNKYLSNLVGLTRNYVAGGAFLVLCIFLILGWTTKSQIDPKNVTLGQKERKPDNQIQKNQKNHREVPANSNSHTLRCHGTISDYKMDNPCLIKEVRRWLVGKSYPSEGTKFTRNPPNLNGQFGAPAIVDAILGGMENGFYIESGAYDGETSSNTLFFELRKNWTGVLVEPNMKEFAKLIGKNRNALHINVCLAGSERVEEINFYSRSDRPQESKVVKTVSDVNTLQKSPDEIEKVICVPFYSLLHAIGNPTIDFLSLDVEGAEIGILKAIPWSKVRIRVILIEVYWIDKHEVNKILTDAGYCLYDKTLDTAPERLNEIIDFVYAHSLYTDVCDHPKIKTPLF